MNNTIIICSRLQSSRLPNKALNPIAGVPMLENLVSRLCNKFKVIIAIPHKQKQFYNHFNFKFANCEVMEGDPESPLARTYEIARYHKIDNIIRITHDKILVDPDLIEKVLDAHIQHEIDYSYLTGTTTGIGFEISTFECLENAYDFMQDKPTEFLSYAFKKVAKRKAPYKMPAEYKSNARFLVDYPQDWLFMDTLLGILGADVSVKNAVKYVNENPELMRINSLPEVTIYTCVYNGIDHIEKCINSAREQFKAKMPGFFEYIVIDDSSKDKTFERVVKNAMFSTDFKWIRNPKNVGLAASSNIALKHAKGKYIMRLDADDIFVTPFSAAILHDFASKNDYDVVYSGFIRDGKDYKPQGHCHIGGALFKKAALDSLKFDDMLRNYDGYDLFKRAKDNLKIGYFEKPVFHYTNRSDSMSNTNLEERARVKADIDARCT